MNSNKLHQLSINEFYVDKSQRGNVLCTKLNDITFVLFHADPDKCPHCEEIIPEFRKLPYIIPNCKFGLVNLNKNQELVRISNSTISPLEYVPYLILYVNGRPYLRYDGGRAEKDLVDFLSQMIHRIKSKSNFVEKSVAKKLEDEIPPYSVGIPYSIVCDEDKGRCYLKYDDAYHRKR